ncbi:hypothetical protein [Brachybacterium phenoliresistens]|uniref:lipopolysaccharide biosynthesis protein n=1 Tax=Brachybacterium phenoliresistens TaxID=396014 RepID=UPI0031D6F739
MTTSVRRRESAGRGPLHEIGLNTLAFGLIIAVQQLVIFPGLAGRSGPVAFSDLILLITVSTIAVNVIGTEASKVSLIRAPAYRSHDLPWDVPRIVMISAGGAGLLVLAVWLLGWLPANAALPCGLIVLLGIARTYATTPDRHEGAYGRVILVHGAYAAGAVAGFLLIGPGDMLLLPFLVAESVSAVVAGIVRLRHRTVRWTMRRTPLYPGTLRAFLGLAAIAVLINGVTYIDRLAITPLLGAGALAVYYSATALSSSLSLITNPAGNAVLARLGRVPDERRAQLLARGLVLVPPLILVFWGASAVIAYAGLALLYPSHLPAALPLLLPVSLTAAFSNAVTLLAPLLQRFGPIRQLLGTYLVYAAAYLIAVLLLSRSHGLLGFAWAGTTAQAVLLVITITRIAIGSRRRPSAASPPREPGEPSDVPPDPRGASPQGTESRTLQRGALP